MRTRNAFVSSVTAAALLATPAAMATGSYGSCKSSLWTVSVLAGPCPVSDPSNPSCVAQGDWTGIQYQVTGAARDHVATLVTANNTVSVATGNQVYSPCKGDPVTDLGEFSCHERAVKINPALLTLAFWVVVDGQQQAVETSVAVKKGSCVQPYAVAGFGREIEANPFRNVTTRRTDVFKGCAVTFELDSVTEDVLNASNDPSQSDPDADCSDLVISTVDKLSLTLDGVGNLGFGRDGEGFLSSGTGSCTTRVVKGKVYTWGSPCP
jgi:hypothetical protein